jgi:hypothetical protein
MQKGSFKLFEDLSVDDVLQYPVWMTIFNVSATHDQQVYQRPLINTDNVTEDLQDVWITLKIKNSSYTAFAQLYKHRTLNRILIWQKDGWTTLELTPDLKAPVTLIAVAKIKEIANVEFVVRSLDDDYAFAVH